MKHDALREKALANFELLLEFWKVDFRKITENEYDLLATWRKDKNFGSCRFNIAKGIGSDFANSGITKEDIKVFGAGFDETDFGGVDLEGDATKSSFDVVGLCQRLYRCRTYQDALKYLDDDLRALARDKDIIVPTEERIKAKQEKQQRDNQRILDYARDLWESAKYHPLKGSIGEAYLQSRGIIRLDKNIRFHPSIPYKPLNTNYPCLLFKVQKYPDGPLEALHRIYLDPFGNKAKVDNPKMALASVKGSAIWFGEPDPILYIAEGPENALTCLEVGAKFVACTIFGSNFHNLIIPSNVKKLLVVPDPDPSGLKALNKLIEEKRKLCMMFNLRIEKLTIPQFKKENGKYMDFNDFYLEGP